MLRCLADRYLGPIEVPEPGDASAVNFRRRARENEARRAARSVEIIDVGYTQAKLDASRWILVGRRMEREFGGTGVKLASERGLEEQCHA